MRRAPIMSRAEWMRSDPRQREMQMATAAIEKTVVQRIFTTPGASPVRERKVKRGALKSPEPANWRTPANQPGRAVRKGMLGMRRTVEKRKILTANERE